MFVECVIPKISSISSLVPYIEKIEMDYLQQLATVDDIKLELDRVEKEERRLSRLILFNLTGNKEFYDLSEDSRSAKPSATEYNRIISDLHSISSSVNGKLIIFFLQIEVVNEVQQISDELSSCSHDALQASDQIKYFNTLKVAVPYVSYRIGERYQVT